MILPYRPLIAAAALLSLLVFIFWKKNASHEGELTLPVITGLYYQTSSGIAGYTEQGTFRYFSEDTITFFLGTAQHHYPLGTVSGQSHIALGSFISSPLRSTNVLRLIVALDTKPESSDDIVLNPDFLGQSKIQQQLYEANWNSAKFSIGKLDLPKMKQASEMTALNLAGNSLLSNTAIFQPLNKKISASYILLRDYNGLYCFYDLDKRQKPDYHGPIGNSIFKITEKGVYEYPSIGDGFGTKGPDGSPCELNIKRRIKQKTFTPIEEMGGFQGLLGCAFKGCTFNHLNGVSVEDYHDGNQRKYRSVALSFDSVTGIFTTKKRGLGRSKGIEFTNLNETLSFSSLLSNQHKITLNGIWQERTYALNGTTRYRCLYFKQGRIYTSSQTGGGRCIKLAENYQYDITEKFTDMWWYSPTSESASLAQLNTPVRWFNSKGEPQYTSFEYQPAGHDWQQGILYRFSQHLTSDDSGYQHLTTYHIAEYKKQLH